VTNSSLTRQPRVRLVLDGVPVDGCRSAEIISRRGAQAASFRILASASSVAKTLGRSWVDKDKLDVAIDFGFLPTGISAAVMPWVRMITGNVDRISFDQPRGLVSLDGRDHAARLIDLPIQDSYLNRTSSELAALLASSCELSGDIDTTHGLIGQYYQIQHTKSALSGFSKHGNGWDLLSELADLEGFDLWVDGTTLHFKQADTTNTKIYDLTSEQPTTNRASPVFTISDLSMERTLGLAGSMQVTVSSWNSRQRQKIIASYPPDTSTATSKQFLILRPNLLPDEAEVLAKNTYNRLRAHQYVVNGTMAGELVLTTQHRLRLAGTGTGWDRIYTIDRIEREMSLEGGYIQHIVGRSEPSGVADDG